MAPSGYHYKYTARGRAHYLSHRVGDAVALRRAKRAGATFVSFQAGPATVRVLDTQTGALVYG